MASDELTVPQLKAILRSLLVPHTGLTKIQMSDAIRERIEWAREVGQTDLSKRTIDELKELLRRSGYQKHWRIKKRADLENAIRGLSERVPFEQSPRAKPRRERMHTALVWTHPLSKKRAVLSTRTLSFSKLRRDVGLFESRYGLDTDLEEIELSTARLHDLTPTDEEADRGLELIEDNAEMMYWTPKQRADHEAKIRRMLGRSDEQ